MTAVAKKFNNDMIADVIYPIMIPAIRSIILLFIIVDSIKIMITIAFFENVYYRGLPYAVVIDIKRKY